MFAAPFTALAAAREVDAAVRLSAKPAGGRAKLASIQALTAPTNLIKPKGVSNQAGTIQSQISALQSAISALQTNESGLATFAANVFAFANSVRQFGDSTADSLNSHYHFSEDQGNWLVTSQAQF
jgi:hypothetical protein